MFTLTHQALDTKKLRSTLSDGIDFRAGAFVSMEGWVRNHNEGKEVLALEYEAYPELAQKEGEKILKETLQNHDLLAASAIHRLGRLSLGDTAIWVGVSSVHRLDAFQACQHIIDTIKHQLPIWKKEFYADGQNKWVNCQHCSQNHPFSQKPEHSH